LYIQRKNLFQILLSDCELQDALLLFMSQMLKNSLRFICTYFSNYLCTSCSWFQSYFVVIATLHQKRTNM